ncbi:hypothetical protein RchiOBHm_Chr4g0390531 [Rosa chinensis]|uniref:Uncharacterized protein n=1 Tax=Rosa chinensis TaxID=74649 RepID=A0A2P6QQ87_ROSCH|nr:hypothetical protein RchiOBHm_Chr4g0390531 [Rosa chinensis]
MVLHLSSLKFQPRRAILLHMRISVIYRTYRKQNSYHSLCIFLIELCSVIYEPGRIS